MPLDLKAPLPPPTQWTAAETALLKDLQGNILNGHGRRHTLNLFLRFAGTAADARKFLRRMARVVPSAFDQQVAAGIFKATGQTGGTFYTVLLASKGYDALHVPAAKRPGKGRKDAFQGGMASRQARLDDPPAADWESGFRKEIHALVIVGDDSRKAVRAAAKALQATWPASIQVVARVAGEALFNANHQGIEHFGYADGVSQPLMMLSQQPPSPTVWDPMVGLDQALVPDPSGAAPGRSSFGSYLVFRKLEQNVRGFKAAEQSLAATLGLTGDAAELAGAMAVGRFEDGTPVVLQNQEGLGPTNRFDYAGDANGRRCPFHAHIRKTNPRGDSVALGASLAQERAHLVVRRGIPYDEIPRGRSDDPNADVPLSKRPEGGVGLLFMCYQRSLEEQFEFVQASWANNAGFARPDTGPDPVIGQGATAANPWPSPWGSAATKTADFGQFVRLRGGEYFFAPSLSALKSM